MLDALHQDHINMNQLLQLLDTNVKQIRQGAVPDLKLMAEAIEYIGHYADIYHHPVEDLIYRHFADKSPELSRLMYQCEQEHHNLQNKTGQVLAPINETLMDGMVPMDNIIDALEAFLIAEKSHLDFEEVKIFPLLKSIAQDSDWKQLAKKAWLETDSMFNEFDSLRYREIYNELNEQIQTREL